MNRSQRHRVVIIGAGISGLATAWWLRRKGFDVTLLEESDRIGGSIQTEYRDGFLVEHGPNSALETTPLIGVLLDDLGIRDQQIYASESAKNRYVVRNGLLHAIPMGPAAFLHTRLWSLRGKLRLLLEPLHGRAEDEESVAQFVRRRLGQELLDYAVDPFVAGVYAGDPSLLSVRAAFPKLYSLEKRYGGLLIGMVRGRKERKYREEIAKDRAKLFSFAGGMETLPRAIGEKLETGIVTRALRSRLSTVGNNFGERSQAYLPKARRQAYSRWQVEYSRNGRKERVEADAIVLSAPAYAAAEIISHLDAETARALQRIEYPPVAMVFIGARQDSVIRTLDGFGFLVPTKEKRQILGTIWSSTIFPGRAPVGSVALTTFVGGSRGPDLVSLNDNQLIDRVLGELRSLMNFEGPPSVIIMRRWHRAIPQYNLGHLEIMEVVDAFEHRFPGLYFSSNFRGGIAVGDCVLNANKTAERVASYLSERPLDVEGAEEGVSEGLPAKGT